MQQNLAASPAAYGSLYPGVDNRYLASATDYFTAAAGYRSLAGSYYPAEYHAALGNGYLDARHSLAEADKLYGSSAAAAAYMSDPRLCSTLRLDNKHGKDRLVQDGGKLIKEEEYTLHQDGAPAYTLPDQVPGHPSSVLYMSPTDHTIPKLQFSNHHHHAGGQGGHPGSPGLRLSPDSPRNASGDLNLQPSNSSSSSSAYCTFSLADICGVAAISTDSVSTLATQEVHTAAQGHHITNHASSST